jgi:hypothetical protein
LSWGDAIILLADSEGAICLHEGKFAGKGTVVYSRDGEVQGEATGSEHACQLGSCSGVRVSVRWETGGHTFPCSKGMTARPGGALQIL